MGRLAKIAIWTVSVPIVLLVMAILVWPLYSPFVIEHKYQSFADVHPHSPSTYNASVKGAQPAVACGGTAGKYNWGESVRDYVSLNGTWSVEQGELSDQPPVYFTHRAPVPGLLNAAEPAFAELGVPSEKREAFWFKRRFEAPANASDTALLCIAKVKYGARVWLNGQPLGEHYGAFTQAEFDLGDAIRWGEMNELIVRIGAERSAIPAFIPVGQDNEKEHWIPGIWDDVNLLFTGAHTIVRTKVETDIETGVATIKSTLRNNTQVDVELNLSQSLREWRSNRSASVVESQTVVLAAGETKTISQSVPVDNMHLWTLDNPFLYVADSVISKQGSPVDDRATRFGFRSVEWRGGVEKGFYLNGKLTYLRGSNFSLHRFFEDKDAGNLAWDEEWVRKLYTSYPREYHWNLFRTSIGRMPNFWYDIADEEGFLIDDEFAFWALPFPPSIDGKPNPKEHLQWSMVELEKEFTSWIQENWNHPSIAWWSASNETTDPKSYEIIERVRGLDMTRQWENGGWQKPHGPADPIEDHPYVFSANFNPVLALMGARAATDIGVLEDRSAMPPHPSNLTSMVQMSYPTENNPYIINEYGWLWLNRDASTTNLTKGVYQQLLGEQSTSDERWEARAYLHAGLTGYWRAQRGYQGVQHFTYLGHSKPGRSFTSDNFIDIENLVMEPQWHEYSKNVWSPVAVYIDKWQDDYVRGKEARMPLIMINDEPGMVNGEVQLVVTDDKGRVLSQSEVIKVGLEGYGQQIFDVAIEIPDRREFVLFAQLSASGDKSYSMLDKRKVGFAHPGVKVASRPLNGGKILAGQP